MRFPTPKWAAGLLVLSCSNAKPQNLSEDNDGKDYDDHIDEGYDGEYYGSDDI